MAFGVWFSRWIICGLFWDASILLTIEVFLLTVRLFTYGGETVSREDQTQFPDGGNRISTVIRKDQPKFTVSNSCVDFLGPFSSENKQDIIYAEIQR